MGGREVLSIVSLERGIGGGRRPCMMAEGGGRLEEEAPCVLGSMLPETRWRDTGGSP